MSRERHDKKQGQKNTFSKSIQQSVIHLSAPMTSASSLDFNPKAVKP